ncbi:MAG TPA: cytochrome c oxidase subunit II [Solirubrobacteraceae bacterium]|nr:cytochrome c oxidase subunit II [Solirubrobacteraceae bacterium]
MPKRPLTQMLILGGIAVVIGIPVALIIPWFPSDASVQSSNVRTLYDVLLIVSVPIFVLVETVVLFSVWKFRMKPGEEEKDGPPIHGNTRLEVIWTAVPAIMLVSLATYAYTVLHSNESSHRGEMVVNVTERQFAFEFSYPQSAGKQVVSPELYLPKGQPVVFHIRSLDVIHSFFVPPFSEKLDAVPGITTTLRVTPTALGTYPAECTELCGAGHSLMRATVRVVTPSAFKAWVSKQKVNGPPPVGNPPANAEQSGVPGSPVSGSTGSSGSSSAASGGSSSSSASAGSGSSAGGSSTAAAQGKAIFTSSSCATCHTLADAGSTGTVGPNLTTHLRSDCATAASKAARGASLAQCIQTAITQPYKYLPPGYQAHIMPPDFASTLGPAKVQALVAYLESVTQ